MVVYRDGGYHNYHPWHGWNAPDWIDYMYSMSTPYLRNQKVYGYYASMPATSTNIVLIPDETNDYSNTTGSPATWKIAGVDHKRVHPLHGRGSHRGWRRRLWNIFTRQSKASLCFKRPATYSKGGGGYLTSKVYRAPSGWRDDFRPQQHTQKLSRFSHSPFWSTSRNLRLPSLALHPLIHYTSPNACPLSYDLRTNPKSAVHFLSFRGGPNLHDLYQLASIPASHEMFLWHPRLPWHVHIQGSHYYGITMEDILTQIYQELCRHVTNRDLYNGVMDAHDREKIFFAYNARQGGAFGGGMLRMDFLGPEVIFLGLVKSRNGTLEIKTDTAYL